MNRRHFVASAALAVCGCGGVRNRRLETQAMAQRASIQFRANAEGTLTYDGKSVPCLGKPALKYPTDLTVQTSDKYERKFSNEFQVWMNWAVLIWGQRGIYIHEGPATLDTNGGPSAGCIHLAPPTAKEFYDWITGPTRITIAYPW